MHNSIATRKRAWSRCIRLALLLDLLFMTTGSAIPRREGYLEQIVHESPIAAAREFPPSSSVSYTLQLEKLGVKFEDSGGLQSATGKNVASLSIVMRQVQFHLGVHGGVPTEETGSKKVGQNYDRRPRRLLRGFRGLRPQPQVWFLDEGSSRRVMEDVTGKQTQPFDLGPPAPPGMVHNEKQDWNQDYAEPDVHPPSSN